MESWWKVEEGVELYMDQGYMDQPGMVANQSCSWSAVTGKTHISLSAFALENLVSRDRFGSSVPRQPAHLHTQAESGAYYLRHSSRVPRRRPYIDLKLPYIRHRGSPEFTGSRNCVPIAFPAESPLAQGR